MGLKPETTILLLLLLAALLLEFWDDRIIRIVNLLPKHRSRKYSKRKLDKIEQIVIHHTAGPLADTPFDIAGYHVRPGNHICAEGCPGISYHLMITRQGTIYQTNELETVSFHVSGQNTRSVGVCLIGNYSEIEPTPKQLKQVRRAIRWIERKVGRRLPVVGHRDTCGGCTKCPGDFIDLNELQ